MYVLINDGFGKQKAVSCYDLKMASGIVMAKIDEFDLGASEWYLSDKTGNVFDDKGTCIAHISYNGRIWAV